LIENQIFQQHFWIDYFFKLYSIHSISHSYKNKLSNVLTRHKSFKRNYLVL
jgi:hypothetical protein